MLTRDGTMAHRIVVSALRALLVHRWLGLLAVGVLPMVGKVLARGVRLWRVLEILKVLDAAQMIAECI